MPWRWLGDSSGADRGAIQADFSLEQLMDRVQTQGLNLEHLVSPEVMDTGQAWLLGATIMALIYPIAEG